MNSSSPLALFDTWQPHLAATALISMRLIPISFLCPVLGGQAVPSFVRLGIVGALSTCLHFSAGVSSPLSIDTLDSFLPAMAKETCLGLTFGLACCFPFETARMAGRFIDLFRGSSAEAALPHAGNRETIAGDALYQLLVTIAFCGLAGPMVVKQLFRSFHTFPLGQFSDVEISLKFVLTQLALAFRSALLLAAPVALIALSIDFGTALLNKVASSLRLQDHTSAAKIMAGALAMVVMIPHLASALENLVFSAALSLNNLKGSL